MAGGFDRAVDRLDAGAGAGAVFVVDRHDHRMAFGEWTVAAIGKFCDACRAADTAQHVDRAEDRVKRSEREEAIEQDKDRQQREVGFLQAHAPEQVGEPEAGDDVEQKDAAEEDRAPNAGGFGAEEHFARVGR